MTTNDTTTGDNKGTGTNVPRETIVDTTKAPVAKTGDKAPEQPKPEPPKEAPKEVKPEETKVLDTTTGDNKGTGDGGNKPALSEEDLADILARDEKEENERKYGKGYVYAAKPGHNPRFFTAQTWKLQGKGNNGWTPVDASAKEAKPVSARKLKK